MRALLVTVVSVTVLAGCGAGAGRREVTGATSTATPPPTGTATPTVTATAGPADAAAAVAQVRAALRRTRAAKTATFVTEGTTQLQQGSLTLRRTGSYDLGRRLASSVQTMSADPPELFASLTGSKTSAADLEARTVVTGSLVFLQMAAWPAKLRGRWLAMSPRDLERAGTGPADLDGSVFPPMLEMLSHARPASAAAAPGVVAVEVPTRHAFVAIPSSSPRKMIAAGLDLAKLTGTVEVKVGIEGGLITRVAFDALDPFVEAAAELGQRGFADALAGIPSSIEVSGHGDPVRIAVPPPAVRLTPDEMEALK